MAIWDRGSLSWSASAGKLMMHATVVMCLCSKDVNYGKTLMRVCGGVGCKVWKLFRCHSAVYILAGSLGCQRAGYHCWRWEVGRVVV